MPFRHTSNERYRIPKVRHQFQNWPAYDAGLTRRGDLMLWFDEKVPTGWQALPAQQAGAATAAEVLNRMIRAAKPLSTRAA